MFATVVPGLSPLVRRELAGLPGVRPIDTGFDGRSDVLLFEVDRGFRDAVRSLRTIEDLFVEIGRTERSSGDKPHWIAGRIWRPERTERALSIWADEVRPLSGVMGYRVIARVLQERSFLRTELRKALTQAIANDKPKWRFADPAQIEIWISEYRPGRLVAGLRLSNSAMRQHDGREVERSGALRPTVAATMVRLAGTPRGALLDPCCGSGTILSEAMAVGWTPVHGSDIDPDAVDAARRNAPKALVRIGDARAMEQRDATIDAVVSNLPFGRQYEMEGDTATWLSASLTEMARVTRPGGRVVLLAPDVPRRAVPNELRMKSRDAIRLLGTSTNLWVFDRS